MLCGDVKGTGKCYTFYQFELHGYLSSKEVAKIRGRKLYFRIASEDMDTFFKSRPKQLHRIQALLDEAERMTLAANASKNVS